MDDVRKLMTKMAGAIQDLQSDTKANTHDLKILTKRMQMMTARMHHMDETLTTLAGTIAGLGSVVEDLYEREGREDAWRQAIEARLDALEKGQPPAA